MKNQKEKYKYVVYCYFKENDDLIVGLKTLQLLAEFITRIAQDEELDSFQVFEYKDAKKNKLVEHIQYVITGFKNTKSKKNVTIHIRKAAHEKNAKRQRSPKCN